MLAIAFLDVSIDFFVCSYVSTYACANACARVKIRLNCTYARECTVLEPYTIKLSMENSNTLLQYLASSCEDDISVLLEFGVPTY